MADVVDRGIWVWRGNKFIKFIGCGLFVFPIGINIHVDICRYICLDVIKLDNKYIVLC